MNLYKRVSTWILTLAVLCTTYNEIFVVSSQAVEVQKRQQVGFLRGPYNLAFWKRHQAQYRRSAAIHFGHGKQHDVSLFLKDMDKAPKVDTDFEEEMLTFLYNPPWTEPGMDMYGPMTSQIAYNLYRAIDWTHAHHEQTYDIMSDKNIPMEDKDKWTERSVNFYLTTMNLPRSVAPLDVTMRRAGVMMKPYFGYFRNNFPKSSTFFFYAHWWHPVIYEAQLIGDNGPKQDEYVALADGLSNEVLADRPMRMLLSREGMPRYSRMSPETANIFDNLHMLHGIAYDILTYPEWNYTQKQAELDRVIKAMSNQPGDEKLTRKFDLPHPDMLPWEYPDWMKTQDGSMNRIMDEMWDEMKGHMLPDDITPEMESIVKEQLRLKMRPGMQEGEIKGSFTDALKVLVPTAMIMEEGLKPGATPTMMVNMMLDGWNRKYANMPDVQPLPEINGKGGEIKVPFWDRYQHAYGMKR